MNKSQSVVCAAKTCFNSSRVQPNLSFFLFPPDCEIAQTWAVKADRKDLISKSKSLGDHYLCADHFDADCFEDNYTRSAFKNGLYPIPSIFKDNFITNRQKETINKTKNNGLANNNNIDKVLFKKRKNDIVEYCRFCANLWPIDILLPIYNNEQIIFSELLQKYVPKQDDDNLPKYICKDCKIKLLNCCNTLETFEVAYNYLKMYYKKTESFIAEQNLNQTKRIKLTNYIEEADLTKKSTSLSDEGSNEIKSNIQSSDPKKIFHNTSNSDVAINTADTCDAATVHNSLVNETDIKYKCSLCLNLLNDKQHAIDHCLEFHPTEKDTITCYIVQVIKLEEKQHTKIKCQCTICPSLFNSKTELIQHSLVNHPEKKDAFIHYNRSEQNVNNINSEYSASGNEIDESHKYTNDITTENKKSNIIIKCFQDAISDQYDVITPEIIVSKETQNTSEDTLIATEHDCSTTNSNELETEIIYENFDYYDNFRNNQFKEDHKISIENRNMTVGCDTPKKDIYLNGNKSNWLNEDLTENQINKIVQSDSFRSCNNCTTEHYKRKDLMNQPIRLRDIPRNIILDWKGKMSIIKEQNNSIKTNHVNENNNNQNFTLNYFSDPLNYDNNNNINEKKTYLKPKQTEINTTSQKQTINHINNDKENKQCCNKKENTLIIFDKNLGETEAKIPVKIVITNKMIANKLPNCDTMNQRSIHVIVNNKLPQPNSNEFDFPNITKANVLHEIKRNKVHLKYNNKTDPDKTVQQKINF